MNPTLTGLFSVIAWGASLPLVRLISEHIGTWGSIGAIFAGSGLLGLLNRKLRREGRLPRRVFRNPWLYARWLFFVLHEAFIITAVSVVAPAHMPFVILLNYLWPTAVIVCSVLLADVRVTRWPAFAAGSVIVVLSLSVEILGPDGFSAGLFAANMDRLAYGLAFLGALSWGLYSAISRREGDKAGGGAVIPWFQLTLGLALPVSVLPGASGWGELTAGWLALILLYCVIQFVAYLCWDLGMRRGNIVALSLCSDFIPWLSLLSSRALLGVELGPATVISALSLVCGAIVTRYGTLGRRQPLAGAPAPEV